jgi:hypothetical protein
MRASRAWWPLLCAIWLACGSEGGGEEVRNPARRGRTHPVDVETAPAASGARNDKPAADKPEPGTEEPAAREEAKPEEEEEKVVRDLDAELQEAFGSPLGCLKQRLAGTDAPTAISISLEVNVLENGMVTRSEASSAQLDDEEMRCVRQRLSALRLRAPVEDAPRSARTTVELALKTPEKSGS